MDYFAIGILTIAPLVLGKTTYDMIKMWWQESKGCYRVINGKKVKTDIYYDEQISKWDNEKRVKLWNKIENNYQLAKQRKEEFRVEVLVNHFEEKNHVLCYRFEITDENLKGLMYGIEDNIWDYMILSKGENILSYREKFRKQYAEAKEKKICTTCNCIKPPFPNLSKRDYLYKEWEYNNIIIDFTYPEFAGV